MENAGVITFNLRTYKTAEAFDDWTKWAKASLVPMLMSSGTTMGIERGYCLEEKLIYRRTISISYYKDLENYLVDSHSAERKAYYNDIGTTWGGKFEESWRSVYLVARRITSTNIIANIEGIIVDKTTRLKEFTEGSEPIILLRGLGLSSAEWAKYDDWFNEWGYDIYLPMLLKAPGIIEYCRCLLSNFRFEGSKPMPDTAINLEYPQELSIIYFENLKAYQNFRKSKELAAFDKTLAAAFPTSLNYKWNVAFRLARRWSR